jgi:hypothetical protein
MKCDKCNNKAREHNELCDACLEKAIEEMKKRVRRGRV